MYYRIYCLQRLIMCPLHHTRFRAPHLNYCRTKLSYLQVWNRCDEPTDPSLERDFYAKRLFPCLVMAAQEQFNDQVGGGALLDAMNMSVARTHLREARVIFTRGVTRENPHFT